MAEWMDRAAWVAAQHEKTLLTAAPSLVEARSEYGTGVSHALFMLRELQARTTDTVDSETKACRWLGYAQAILIEYGVLTLDAAKAINLSSRVAAQVGKPHAPERVDGFAQLRTANVARNAEWGKGVRLGLSFRGNELAGEVGELADVVICVDLIAMDLGLDLHRAIVEKFNATSDARGLATRMEVMDGTLGRGAPDHG